MSPKTAFDADVLIYAAAKDHPLGIRVAALFADAAAGEAVGLYGVQIHQRITLPARSAGHARAQRLS